MENNSIFESRDIFDSGSIPENLQEFSFQTVVEIEGETDIFGEFDFESFVGAAPMASATADALFDFGVAVINSADASFDALIDAVAEVTAVALEDWAEFIVGADGASLDVAVTIADLGEGVVASASAGSFFISAGPPVNGFTEIFTSAQLELITGTDFNGDTPDIVISVGTDFLLDASFDTAPDREPIPGVLDLVSVLTHEIGHGLGFLAFRDNTGVDFAVDIDGDGIPDPLETTYGTNVIFEDLGDPFLTPSYIGDNLVDIYGEPVTLESTFDSPASDVSHFALFNPDGTIADTALALMNPVVIPGDIVTIGAAELAVLADLGYTLDVPADLGLINTLDTLPFTPTASVSSELAVVDGAVLVTVELDAPSLFITLPTSVGVEIVGADGATVTQRVTFLPGESAVQVAVDPSVFLDVAAGDDFIIGGNGSDIIDGGAGSDTIDSGNGGDVITLAFGAAGDTDTIVDFNENQDTLIFDGFAFVSAADVFAAAAEVGDDVIVTLDAATGQTLVLEDTDLDDFLDGDIEVVGAEPAAPAGAATAASVLPPDGVFDFDPSAALLFQEDFDLLMA